jgi:cell division protein FtsI/penicillin-binding protein 2
MIKASQLRWLCFLAVLLVLAFVGLGYRLVDLQILSHDELRAKALANTQRAYLIEPRRGEIRDIRGNLLATSQPAKTICADPSLIGRHQPEIARAIAPYLQMEATKVQELLSRTWRTNSENQLVTNRYVVLKRKVPLDNWKFIQQTMTNLNFGFDDRKLTNKLQARFYRDLRQSAIFADPIEDQLRAYPNKQLAAHILGYVGMHETEVNGRPILETIGMDGIELMLNPRLSGVRGWRVTEKDKRNRELVAYREHDIEAANGLNAVLTIDAGVQYIVEAALMDAVKQHTPVSAMCTVVRPRTGEIVAMAVWPTYDPNLPGGCPEEYRKNRVIADINEPGSTFKIVVVSGALTDHLVRLGDAFFCENGIFSFAGHSLHDHGRYGNLSVETIITKSSNIGAAKIGIRLGQNRLYEHMRNFGFGQKTGIALPGEVSGILHPTKNWTKVSIAQIPMGHGVAVTPMQMAMAMSAIANKGLLMKPKIVDRLEDCEGNIMARFEPQSVRQVMTPEASFQMVKALKTVVTKEGTASRARLDHYTVAGKTGTAQKAENGGYSHEKYFSSFIGFFPADNPELCIGISLDCPKSGHYGGEVCAPVFKEIAERTANYLNIRPEPALEEKNEKLATKHGKPVLTATRQ